MQGGVRVVNSLSHLYGSAYLSHLCGSDRKWDSSHHNSTLSDLKEKLEV